MTFLEIVIVAYISIILHPQLIYGENPVNSTGLRHRRALSSYSFSQNDIPGTDLKTGTFYVLRMKRFPNGYVSWSTRRHENGYNYIFLDNTPAHIPKYGKDGPWHKDTQWAFLSTSEPGWYHLINRGTPCQYSTWSNAETIDGDGTFYLIVDPSYPGTHTESDFLFKPYQPSSEGANKPYYQLKLKSMESAVISWNAGNTTSDSYYIHVESTDDQNWLKRYSWGHVWYDDTLFSFEPVNDNEEERDIETEEDLLQWGQQHQYETLVGQMAYDYSAAGNEEPDEFIYFLFHLLACIYLPIFTN